MNTKKKNQFIAVFWRLSYCSAQIDFLDCWQFSFERMLHLSNTSVLRLAEQSRLYYYTMLLNFFVVFLSVLDELPQQIFASSKPCCVRVHAATIQLHGRRARPSDSPQHGLIKLYCNHDFKVDSKTCLKLSSSKAPLFIIVPVFTLHTVPADPRIIECGIWREIREAVVQICWPWDEEPDRNVSRVSTFNTDLAQMSTHTCCDLAILLSESNAEFQRNNHRVHESFVVQPMSAATNYSPPAAGLSSCHKIF